MTIYITHRYCFQTQENFLGQLDISRHSCYCIMSIASKALHQIEFNWSSPCYNIKHWLRRLLSRKLLSNLTYSNTSTSILLIVNIVYLLLKVHFVLMFIVLYYVKLLIFEEKLDILTLLEMGLDDTIGISEICLAGMSIFRRDQNRRGGGVAILIIPNTLRFALQPDLNTNSIESLWLEIYPRSKRSMLICSTYRHFSQNDFSSIF